MLLKDIAEGKLKITKTTSIAYLGKVYTGKQQINALLVEQGLKESEAVGEPTTSTRKKRTYKRRTQTKRTRTKKEQPADES